MANQMTEMLKGTLEGIVLTTLADRPAYGYDITARLRDEGFSDLVEGTVYALLIRIEQRGLVDVEKVPSAKGPPRKVYTLNDAGRTQLDEFWLTWTSLSQHIERLRKAGERAGTAIAAGRSSTDTSTDTDTGSNTAAADTAAPSAAPGTKKEED